MTDRKILWTSKRLTMGADEYLNYAEQNRAEWETKGQEQVEMYVEKYYTSLNETKLERSDQLVENGTDHTTTSSMPPVTIENQTEHLSWVPPSMPSVKRNETEHSSTEPTMPLLVEGRCSDSTDYYFL